MLIDIRGKLPWTLLGVFGVLLGLSMMMVVGPAWVYAENADHFVASPVQIFKFYLPFFLGLITTVLAILVLIPLGLARWFALVFAAVGTTAWIEGTFLVHDFGLLDGQNWHIKAPAWRIAVELAFLATVGIIVWRFSSRSPGIATVLILVIGAASAAEPFIQLPDKPSREPTTNEGLFQFSSEKNLLIVLLDGMQSEIFEEVVQENPDILSSLDGFTYFPDTAGVGYSTVLTIPAIHSGVEYQRGVPIQQYFERVRDSSFLNELPGYSTILVNPLYGVCPSGAVLCTTAAAALTSVSTVVAGEANELLSMGVFRIAPLFLKKAVYNSGKWRQFVWSKDPRTVHYSVEGNAFMEEFGARAALSSPVPTAKFLHLFSTHLPVALGENCTYAGDLKSTRQGFKRQAECALRSFSGMMNNLRLRGILDRTAVVLLSDHGSGGWESSRGIPTDAVRSYLLAVANPTLAIKPIGSSAPMQQDASPMSLADIPGIACKLISDCKRPSAPKQRVRQYQHYAWDGLGWNNDEPVAVTPYRISGPVFDGRNWTRAPK